MTPYMVPHCLFIRILMRYGYVTYGTRGIETALLLSTQRNGRDTRVPYIACATTVCHLYSFDCSYFSVCVLFLIELSALPHKQGTVVFVAHEGTSLDHTRSFSRVDHPAHEDCPSYFFPAHSRGYALMIRPITLDAMLRMRPDSFQ